MNPIRARKLVRRWTLPIVALTLIGAIAAYVVSKGMTPIYEAKGEVLVVAAPGSSGAGTINITATQATTTAATLLTEQPLVQEVIGQLQLNTDVETLAKQITATPQTNTNLVDVSARDPSPKQAARIANALMKD